MAGRFFTIKQVSELCGVTPKTLYQWRRRQEGPPYVKMGGKCVRYLTHEFEAWFENQRGPT